MGTWPVRRDMVSYRIFIDLQRVTGADVMVYDSTPVEDQDRSLRVPPKLLIEVMSDWNYTDVGEDELRTKLVNSFQAGLEVAWIIHPGVKRNPRGVQSMVGTYDPNAPLLLADEKLPDAGLNLSFSARQALE